MDFSPEVGPSLSCADRLRFERGIEQFRKEFNQQFLVVVEENQEAKGLLGDSEGRLFCHYVEEPGEIDEYWSLLRGMKWSGLHAERHRLYERRAEAIDQTGRAIPSFGKLYAVLKEEPIPESLAGVYDDWLGYVDRHLAIWRLCLWLPIWNRLHALARRECYFHSGHSPPESFIHLVEDEETQPQRGDNPNEEKWDRRRRLAVRLLLDEDHSYETVSELRAALAREDEDWGYDLSAVRKYFDSRLDGEKRSTIERWEQIALRFRVELDTGVDLSDSLP